MSRFCELKTENTAFLFENNSLYADLFNNEIWLAQVAFRANVFEHLNSLNVSMQGRGHNIIEQSGKVTAFKKKFTLWANHFHKDRLDMFPNSSNETQQLETTGKKCTRKGKPFPVLVL